MGVFVSSLTESQVIAAVVSVVFIFVGYVMAGICNLISPVGNLLTKILSVYDLTTPFIDLINGNLKLASVLYYISVIFLMLFFTTQSIQKRRYSVSVRHLKKGASVGRVISGHGRPAGGYHDLCAFAGEQHESGCDRDAEPL